MPALSTWAGDPHSASPFSMCHTTTLQAQLNMLVTEANNNTGA